VQVSSEFTTLASGLNVGEHYSQRVVDLTTQEILAVIKSGGSLVGSIHPAIIYFLAFCVSPMYANQ
jgi:hypothetical protein